MTVENGFSDSNWGLILGSCQNENLVHSEQEKVILVDNDKIKIIDRDKSIEKILTLRDVIEVSENFVRSTNNVKSLSDIKVGLLHLSDIIDQSPLSSFKSSVQNIIIDINVRVISDFIIGNKSLSDDVLKSIINLVFTQPGNLFDGSSGASLFERLMAREDSNFIYDKILERMNNDQLNDNPDWKSQVFDYTFSAKRYAGILMDEERLSPLVIDEARGALEDCQVDLSNYTDVKDGQTQSVDFQRWLWLRKSPSTSISGKDQAAPQCNANWLDAQDYVRTMADTHRDQGIKLTVGDIRHVHRILTHNELSTAGKPRYFLKQYGHEGLVVRAGGNWRCVFCHPKYLNDRLGEMVSWINSEIDSCNRRDGNPIIVAAQVYQRVLSLHPFENGNGRIARLAMDYILERYHLPPCILTQVLEDGVFPLRVDPKNHEELLRRVIQGVRLSAEMMHAFLPRG